ncbi:MAG: YefM protein (antitoxin to YoeB) [uncultured Thiotrichaceae bacterium]|uniref:Antitoxin n=1 Tax=uncultured Thiotrichaceae bacterium TaxID=298394 RepID=A0A6S6TCM4_9GAMM|nr:MAG: YefM protein (antitoxin to YoeB) [uncultured Thiotrichaceae bacterium]
MKAVTYSEARNNLASMMDRTTQDRETIIITRRGGESAVLMSLEDYNSWKETEHLLSSPTNAKRLLDAIENAKGTNHIVQKELIEE